jgi:hypothetical protein
MAAMAYRAPDIVIEVRAKQATQNCQSLGGLTLFPKAFGIGIDNSGYVPIFEVSPLQHRQGFVFIDIQQLQRPMITGFEYLFLFPPMPSNTKSLI